MDSVTFEHQVKKIHDVLVQNYGVVTWNDKIPDPDNPKQNRQIDISVRTKNKIIHIECRHHKKPQDAKWIEELYGRKISLRANSMIGVSSSGFTDGAIKKAQRLGVFTFNLSQISKETIKNLGEQTVITFTYYRFSNIEIGFYLDSIKNIQKSELEKLISSQGEYFTILFNQIKYELSKNAEFIFPYGFNFPKIDCHNMKIYDQPIVGMSVRGDVDQLTIDYVCPLMWSFESSNGLYQPLAFIEKSNNKQLEIIKSKSGFSQVTIDLSLVPQSPPNCIFYGIEFNKLPGSKIYPPKFTIIGLHEHAFHLKEAGFIIADIKK